MSNKLLLEIARCPIVRQCIDNSTCNDPCSDIVHTQGSLSLDDHQVPEPWSGHIDKAPILFVSSNPSISDTEIFPIGQWLDEDIIDYFNNRFGGGKQLWIKDSSKGLGKDGAHLHATYFWACVKNRARELLECDVEPGVDYALTEVVHCKSKKESGVREVGDFCAKRYFDCILTASAAIMIVVLGKTAREVIVAKLDIPNNTAIFGPVNICGRERIVTFLPHPAAFGNSTFAKCFPENDLQSLRKWIHQMSLS